MTISKADAMDAIQKVLASEFDQEFLNQLKAHGLITNPYGFITSLTAEFSLALDEVEPKRGFVPDWDEIEYDWLAMDADGKWYSHEDQPVWHILKGEWISNLTFDAVEENIEFIHDIPQAALYYRYGRD